MVQQLLNWICEVKKEKFQLFDRANFVNCAKSGSALKRNPIKQLIVIYTNENPTSKCENETVLIQKWNRLERKCLTCLRYPVQSFWYLPELINTSKMIRTYWRLKTVKVYNLNSDFKLGTKIGIKDVAKF